jgi:hypothetical protein
MALRRNQAVKGPHPDPRKAKQRQGGSADKDANKRVEKNFGMVQIHKVLLSPAT